MLIQFQQLSRQIFYFLPLMGGCARKASVWMSGLDKPQPSI